MTYDTTLMRVPKEVKYYESWYCPVTVYRFRFPEDKSPK
jgi:hypothetical protein